MHAMLAIKNVWRQRGGGIALCVARANEEQADR